MRSRLQGAAVLRTLVTALLFATVNPNGAQAQNPISIKAAESACGPAKTRFDVDLSQQGTPGKAPSGNAMIYVIENSWLPHSPVVRIAMDGKWVGATRGWTYWALEVAPGEHHLCISKQTRSNRFDYNVALAPLRAQAGSTYYFLADTAGAILPSLLSLEPVDPDEGKLLVAERALAQPHQQLDSRH